MLGGLLKIPSGVTQKMVNFKPLKKNFWSRKRNKKTSTPQPESPPVPACGESPSKCLDTNYGKPIPKPKKSLLNFCRLKPEMKEKPSNCDEKECEKRETFLEYLFGKNTKKIDNTHPSTPPIKYILCREYSAPKVQELLEPQPKSPPKFPAPKAVNTKKFIKKSEKIPSDCSAAAFLAEKYTCENLKKCRDIKMFKVPFEELQPPRKTKQKFICSTGVDYENIFNPAKRNCCVEAARVGRVSKFPGEIPKPPSSTFTAEGTCDVSVKKLKGTSTIERLKAMVSTSRVCSMPGFKDSR